MCLEGGVGGRSGGRETGEAYSKDDRPHIIIEPRRPHRFLMRLRRPCLFTQHEPRTDPHGTRPQHQRRRQTLSIEQTSRSHNLHLIARHGALFPLDHLRDRGDQYRGRHVPGVAAALAALRADHVGADVEAFLHVLGVPDHVHVEDSGFVQALDDVFRGDAHGGDEEFGTRVDDDGDEVVEFAFGVVVAVVARDVSIVQRV